MKQTSHKMIVRNIGLIGLVFYSLLATPALASEINPKNVIKYVNEARQEAGLEKLVTSDKLTMIAKQKANDMVEHKYFAHTSPAGLSPWHWFEKNNYDYKYAGENLAINFTTAEAQQKAWMESPTHRKNILNFGFYEIGVAVVAGEINGKMGIIAVQEFGSLSGVTGGSSKGKNFSAEKDPAISKEEVDVKPMVLSVKNMAEEKITKEDLPKMIAAENNIPLDSISVEEGLQKFFTTLMLLMLILPVIVLQLAFVGRFFRPLWERYHPAINYQEVNVPDPTAYLKELNEKKNIFDRLRHIKIIRSG